QIGHPEARAEQNFGSADALKGSHDVPRKRHDTFVVRVCQITFRQGPDEFVGIAFGRVAGEAMGRHVGRPLEKYLDVVMSMDLSAIPEQYDRAAQVTEEVPEKRDDLGLKTRSLPDGRPGLADVGMSRNPLSSREREMRASGCGVFLPDPFL